MTALDTLATGLAALRINRLRSILTVLGMIIGVAAVVCMVAVGSGAQAEIAEKIRTLGSNLLLVMPGAQRSGGAHLAPGTRATLSEEDAAAIAREIPAVQVAAPLVSQSIEAVAGNRNWQTLVAGITPDYLIARGWQIETGRAFAAGELQGAGKVAIIGSALRDELFPGSQGVGESLRLGKVPFTVIGVLARKGQGAAGRSQDDVAFIPLPTATSRVLGAVRGHRRDSLDLILVKLADPEALAPAARELEALLRSRHRVPPEAAADFTIENPADVLAARQSSVRTLGYLLLSIASVSLIVGGISIMNIMLVSVTERTREIGLRMAVGARPRDILQQFLTEAVALALVGGLFGVVAGCASAMAIAWRANWPVLISPGSLALACGFAALVGIAFGLYPASRAAQLDPIAALRSE